MEPYSVNSTLIYEVSTYFALLQWIDWCGSELFFFHSVNTDQWPKLRIHWKLWWKSGWNGENQKWWLLLWMLCCVLQHWGDLNSRCTNTQIINMYGRVMPKHVGPILINLINIKAEEPTINELHLESCVQKTQVNARGVVTAQNDPLMNFTLLVTMSCINRELQQLRWPTATYNLAAVNNWGLPTECLELKMGVETSSGKMPLTKIHKEGLQEQMFGRWCGPISQMLY